MSVGAWSADYGSPWSAPAAAPRCSAAADALALNGMGNSLSYFNGGGGGAATATAPSSAAAPRRPSASRRSSGDARSRRSFVDPSGGDDDKDEYHDSTPYFSADPTAAPRARAALDSFKHDAASSSEDAAQRSGSAKSTRNGRAHPVAPPPTHPTTASVVRDRSAPSCINNNDASLKDRFAPAAASNGFSGRAAEVCANDASVPAAAAAVAPAVRNSSAARAPVPPPRNLPVRSGNGGGGGVPLAAPDVAGKLAGGYSGDGGRTETFAPSPSADASGGSSASVAKRTRPGCAPRTLVDIDKELANIISTVEQLSQKANSVSPAADAAGGTPARNGYASATPAPQLSPRDPNPSNDLANELRSAIEARVKRSVSLKDQPPPASGTAATAAASAHRHRRTNSLTHLDDSSGDGHRQLERVDSEARSRDRRARLQHMERRREQQLSEVRGGACADIAPVKEDLCADGEQP